MIKPAKILSARKEAQLEVLMSRLIDGEADIKALSFAGFAVVPKTLTEAMLSAGAEERMRPGSTLSSIYEAIIAAAP